MRISTANIIKERALSDKFIGIETAEGELYAAISDFSCTEKAEVRLLKSLSLNRLILNKAVHKTILLDGNLSENAILKLFQNTNLRSSNCNLISVSSPKSENLLRIISHAKDTKVNFCIYLNFGEAKSITGQSFRSIKAAATYLLRLGLSQIIITDGTNMTCSATKFKSLIKYCE